MTSIYGMKANMHGHELEDISSMGWEGLAKSHASIGSVNDMKVLDSLTNNNYNSTSTTLLI